MDKRQPIDGPAAVTMTVMCAIWGLQQVAIKVAAPDIAPIFQIALRSGIAAVLVGLILILRRNKMTLNLDTWRGGLLVGALFALEYVAVGEGLRYTSAAHMVIFLYTAPIFAAIGLHVRFPSEHLTAVQWGGILLAFAGVIVAFFAPGESSASMADQRLGDALGLLGAAAWGATTVTIRCSRLAEAPAPLTLFYQLAGAFVILAALAWATGQTGVHFSAITVASLAFQTVVFSFLSLLVWFWMLGRYLGSRLGVLSFMTPLFGVVFGVWLLDETLQSSFIVGSVLVLVGIVVVSGHDLFRLRMARLVKD
ncbi:DMT family transporter [Pseudomonas sp. Z18(2022)]|uniref:DMT family transporter n=1 Tax=Pseudomonas sp. Z18(2022) TaxID=2983410 RepID=UPI002E800623|nr:DMT family transporter [Pseudomonas sp. Z18(2022)]